jgi:GGDEF domain-containing protein
MQGHRIHLASTLVRMLILSWRGFNMTETLPGAPDTSLPVDFRESSERVLAYLREHHSMGFWSITRVENGRQTYLVLGQNAYGLPPGGSHPWASSICVRMVDNAGPRIAPVVEDVPAYAAAAVREAVPIRAYSGSPILDVDGSIFGVICGISPEENHGPTPEQQPMLDLLGGLLSDVLRGERLLGQAQRLELELEAAGDRDALTGLAGQRTWDSAINQEFQRFTRLADPTCVVFLSVKSDPRYPASSDDVARRAATALREVLPRDAVAARLGDHFGLLLRNTPEVDGLQLTEALVRRLNELEIRAYAGCAGWRPSEGPFVAIDEAFEQMTSDARVDVFRSMVL